MCRHPSLFMFDFVSYSSLIIHAWMSLHWWSLSRINGKPFLSVSSPLPTFSLPQLPLVFALSLHASPILSRISAWFLLNFSETVLILGPLYFHLEIQCIIHSLHHLKIKFELLVVVTSPLILITIWFCTLFPFCFWYISYLSQLFLLEKNHNSEK